MVFENRLYIPLQFQVDKLEDDIRRSALTTKLTGKESNPPINKWKSDCTIIDKRLFGINPYAFFAGFIGYHTTQLYIRNILLNEMGYKGALKHFGICLTVGLASGVVAGILIGKDISLNKKTKQLKTILNHKAE